MRLQGGGRWDIRGSARRYPLSADHTFDPVAKRGAPGVQGSSYSKSPRPDPCSTVRPRTRACVVRQSISPAGPWLIRRSYRIVSNRGHDITPTRANQPTQDPVLCKRCCLDRALSPRYSHRARLFVCSRVDEGVAHMTVASWRATGATPLQDGGQALRGR